MRGGPKDTVSSGLVRDGGGFGGDCEAGLCTCASSMDWMRPFSFDFPGLFLIAIETLLRGGSSEDSDFLSEGQGLHLS